MGQKSIFFILNTKTPLTLSFFTDFDINAHEGPALDGKSESVLILKNSFFTITEGQKLIFFRFLRQKHP